MAARARRNKREAGDETVSRMRDGRGFHPGSAENLGDPSQGSRRGRRRLPAPLRPLPASAGNAAAAAPRHLRAESPERRQSIT
jgi:hypothetical protein